MKIWTVITQRSKGYAIESKTFIHPELAEKFAAEQRLELVAKYNNRSSIGADINHLGHTSWTDDNGVVVALVQINKEVI